MIGLILLTGILAGAALYEACGAKAKQRKRFEQWKRDTQGKRN